MTAFNSVNDTPTEDAVKGRRFQARVVDNLDPLLKQRIKVEIPNLMEGPPELLPWIGPLVQSKFGMTEIAVSVNVPVIGSIVEVEFQDGDLAYGLMTASLHTEISLMLGPLEVNYPNRRGWLDPMANWSYIDITPGMVEFQLHHKSGTQYTTYDDGRVHHFAVNLYHIEAPDIREDATFTHVVTSTNSTHTASESHRLETVTSELEATERHTTTSPEIRLIAEQFIRAEASQYVEIVGTNHVTIRGGRIDLNP